MLTVNVSLDINQIHVKILLSVFLPKSISYPFLKNEFKHLKTHPELMCHPSLASSQNQLKYLHMYNSVSHMLVSLRALGQCCISGCINPCSLPIKVPSFFIDGKYNCEAAAVSGPQRHLRLHHLLS